MVAVINHLMKNERDLSFGLKHLKGKKEEGDKKL